MDDGHKMFAAPMPDFAGLSVHAAPKVQLAVGKLPRWSVEIAVDNFSVLLNPVFPPEPEALTSPSLKRAVFFTLAALLGRTTASGHDPRQCSRSRQQTAWGVPVSRDAPPAIRWMEGGE